MTNRRKRDLVVPVNSNYRFDPQTVRTLESTRTNASSRWNRDEYDDGSSKYRHNLEFSTSSKVFDLSRPKLEILRANSPTLKRLLAARAKLEKYANGLARMTSASRQSHKSTKETVSMKPNQPIFNPKGPSTTTITTNLNVPFVPSGNDDELQSSSMKNNFPSEKVTYEKLWTNTGNVKQKCSLEIWLPKANNEEEEDRTTIRSISPDHQTTDQKLTTLPNSHSRRSSITKTNPNGQSKLDTTALNDLSTKKTEPVRPRVYHYVDYIMDPTDDRPRSSKSVTTVKSDGTGSLKSQRRQQTRSQGRRQSVSTTQSEEILRFSTTEVTNSSKNPRTTLNPSERRAQTKTSNPSMITELMHKYSLMKKTHAEIIQTRLQIEKSATELKPKVSSSKEINSIRPPPIPEPTSLVPPESSSASMRKMLDTNFNRMTVEPSTNNGKLLDRRGTPRRAHHPEIYSQSRIYSVTNSNQQRQATASMPINVILPTVVDFPNNSFNSGKGSSRFHSQFDNSSMNLTQYSFQGGVGSIDQSPSRFSRRSNVNIRPQIQNKQEIATPIVQIVHNQGQPYQTTSTSRNMPNNKVFVQFNARNHSRNERHILVPD